MYGSECNLMGRIGCREIQSELLISRSREVAQISDLFDYICFYCKELELYGNCHFHTDREVGYDDLSKKQGNMICNHPPKLPEW